MCKAVLRFICGQPLFIFVIFEILLPIQNPFGNDDSDDFIYDSCGGNDTLHYMG